MNEEDFYMILPSNSCPTTHPDNNANLFIVDWETPIKLVGNWKVAITEFSFIYSSTREDHQTAMTYPIIVKGSDSVLMYYFPPPRSKLQENVTRLEGVEHSEATLLGEDGHVLITSSSVPFSVKFESREKAHEFGFSSDYYTSIISPIRAENKPPNNGTTIYRAVNFIRTYKNVEIRKIEKILFNKSLLFDNDEALVKYVKATCEKIFENVSLDFQDFIEIVLLDGIKEVTMDDYVADILGFDNPHLKGKKSYKGNKKPKLMNTYTQMYVYSSIVSPILVGGVFVPLIRCVWIENKYRSGELVNEILDNLMYIPVSSTNINKIEINIRDDSGKLVNFVPNSKTSVTLHFQKYD